MNVMDYIERMTRELIKTAKDLDIAIDDKLALLIFTQLHLVVFEVGLELDRVNGRLAALEAKLVNAAESN